MSFSLLAAVLTLSSVLADKPAVAPQYNPAAPIASASSPVYPAQAVAAAPREDTYGSPAAQPATNTDTYGSPQAPVDGEQSSVQLSVLSPLNIRDSIITLLQGRCWLHF